MCSNSFLRGLIRITYCVSFIYILELRKWYFAYSHEKLLSRSFRLLITHARRQNYRGLIIPWKTVGNSLRKLQWRSTWYAWSLFRIARIEKLIDHPATMAKIPGRYTGVDIRRSYVSCRISKRCAGRIMLKLSNLTTTSVSSQYFSTLSTRPAADYFSDVSQNITQSVLFIIVS